MRNVCYEQEHNNNRAKVRQEPFYNGFKLYAADLNANEKRCADRRSYRAYAEVKYHKDTEMNGVYAESRANG